MSRSQKAKTNIIWGIVNKFVVMLGPFAVRTAIIWAIGIEYAGLNGLFSSILTVLNMSEMGVGVAIVYNMYRPIAENNNSEVCALLNLYKKIYKVIGTVIFAAGIALTPFIPKMISGDIPKDINIYLLYLIFLANTVISYLMYSYRVCLLTANQRNDVESKISTTLYIVTYVIQICALIYLKNYYVYVLVLVLYTVLYNFCIYIYTKRKFPQFVSRGKVSEDVLAGLKHQVGGLVVVKVATATRNSFDSIVISATLGLTSVAIYNNYYYIMNAVASFVAVLCTSLSGGIGNSLICDSSEKIHDDFVRINCAYMWIGGLCTTYLTVLYQPFMKIWVGETLTVPNYTMILFAVYFILTRMTNIAGQYLDAAGLFSERKWFAILEAIANLTLNIILGKIWGMPGIIIATMLTIYFINFYSVTYIVYRKIFARPWKKFCFFQTAYVFLIVVLAICIHELCEIIMIQFSIESLLAQLILNFFMTTVLYGSVTFLICRRIAIFKNTFTWLRKRVFVR